MFLHVIRPSFTLQAQHTRGTKNNNPSPLIWIHWLQMTLYKHLDQTMNPISRYGWQPETTRADNKRPHNFVSALTQHAKSTLSFPTLIEKNKYKCFIFHQLYMTEYDLPTWCPLSQTANPSKTLDHRRRRSQPMHPLGNGYARNNVPWQNLNNFNFILDGQTLTTLSADTWLAREPEGALLRTTALLWRKEGHYDACLHWCASIMSPTPQSLPFPQLIRKIIYLLNSWVQFSIYFWECNMQTFLKLIICMAFKQTNGWLNWCHRDGGRSEYPGGEHQ